MNKLINNIKHQHLSYPPYSQQSNDHQRSSPDCRIDFCKVPRDHRWPLDPEVQRSQMNRPRRYEYYSQQQSLFVLKTNYYDLGNDLEYQKPRTMDEV